ncbi:MAG: type IV secretion system DNA-binding domain-containing protein [Chloroflexi bacterium]|nr:type IV secretion system DNA-binding domain-containing protein [Chloroflexota bacterium]
MKPTVPNPFRRPAPDPPVLLQVTPPRTGERTLLGVENLLGSIAVPEPFSLELAAGETGVGLMVRCHRSEAVRSQVAAHYPQARVRELAAAEDPLAFGASEEAWSLTLRASGPDYVPLRTFQDRDLLDPGSDPLLALVGALGAAKPEERLVARLKLRALGPGGSRPHLARLYERPGQPPQPPAAGRESGQGGPDPLALTVGVLGLGGFALGYNWLEAGQLWNLAGLCAAAAVALIGGGWFKARWNRSRNRVFDPQLIREKVERSAFLGEVELIAVLPRKPDQPDDQRRSRAHELLERVAAAYAHYNHPGGAEFRRGKVRPLPPQAVVLQPAPAGLFGSNSVLGVREAAALWHPPGPSDETHELERARAKVLLPPRQALHEGALVGDTTADMPREILFPDDLLRRHHLYVARTRMGKSTLMRHIVAHKLQEKAAGRDTDALVVVDPHADLVSAILEQVPESLVSEVRLIDLADERGAVGINLLDARVFSDRDRTADSVVRVARGLWEQWGPRMQSILEQTVKTLHEANQHPATEEHEQYTMLDALKLLSHREFRLDVLKKVRDPFLLEWWARDFGGWRTEYQAEALAPVQTRLTYYASSERARAILSQPRSTVDLRRTILEGGILLVSTAQGAVGRDVAALVGASVLNLLDSVIREQERLHQDRRRGALVVVDEMQTIPGVEFESMLSELGKYGAAFLLATQSLSKLDALSPTMRDTLLANIGCLAAFQVSSPDARELTWELGRQRLSEDDLVGQPRHHCYVRASVGMDTIPAFSMTVRKPQDGSPEIAARIRQEAEAYLTSADDIAAQQAERRKRLEQLERLAREAAQAEQEREQAQTPVHPPAKKKPRKQRSKRKKPDDRIPQTGT